jgi:YfiR/HmsC-like
MSSRRAVSKIWARARTLVLIGCLLGLAFPLRADEAPVPVSMQVELMLKVAAYDKNLATRAAGRVRLMVLVKRGDADSARSAAQAIKALSNTDKVIGLPLESSVTVFTDAASLARQANEGSVSIVYVMPGFVEAETEAMAGALSGVSVLSVGALPKYTARGTVIGFDLAGGKPKLLVHLGQAKKQRVELSSSVLKLMRVIE